MQIGKFSLISPLGNGNFGFVFHVLDTLLDAERAVKVIMLDDSCTAEQFVSSFNEAKILELCRHSHIVEVKEVDVYDFQGRLLPCIITEYLKNGSAQDLLENQFVSVQQACKTIVDVLFGLEHAHAQNIYHRDIKPANILYTDNWRAKLSDFGLAFGLNGQVFNFVGYNIHLPPEVLANEVQDDLSDIYSLGVTFFRIINNLKILALPNLNKPELFKAVNKERFPVRAYSDHIPDSIKKMVNKGMRAERQKRYGTCLEFRQAIQRIKFFIDWHRTSQTSWSGICKDDVYSLEYLRSARNRHSLTFKKNERKVNDYCYADIHNETDAFKKLHQIIRETTLKI